MNEKTEIGLIDRAEMFGNRLAIVDSTGETTYRQLLRRTRRTSAALLDRSPDLSEARVAFMVEPGARYVEILWGIWAAGGIAVPLCLTHPAPELEYAMRSTGVGRVIADKTHIDTVGPVAEDLGVEVLTSDGVCAGPVPLPSIDARRRALMLFTSGTTGRPKAVVTTHANIRAQVGSLIAAWGWSADDRTLLTLPLHHLHGILNVVSCSLWSGAVCQMHPRFEASTTWNAIASGDLTVYMAVPTIYHRLIRAWDEADPVTREQLSTGAAGLRLMVSGSAALPVPVLEKWAQISGHTLLERYGMTEIGMALSNPLKGDRRPGFVGEPLPGVNVRLVGPNGEEIPAGESGEIQVRGQNVFLEYWDDEQATREAFTESGWFRTGDVARVVDGAYRILGRDSVDILKTGGEKVSALEIENVLLEHESVRECAVVGIEDDQWGQRIVAVVVGEARTQTQTLKEWCRIRLAPFKVPKEFILVEELPRNAMGKVQKKAVRQLVSSPSTR